jgi:hypothetical protein
MKETVSKTQKSNVSNTTEKIIEAPFPLLTLTLEERLQCPYTQKKMAQARKTLEKSGLPDRSWFE